MTSALGSLRTFGLSGVASALSFALYALFSVQVGVGARSDTFFSVLAIAQTFAAILYAPYEQFALRTTLDRLAVGDEPFWGLLFSFVCLSAGALVVYYGAAETLIAPLFGRAYTDQPALWRHNLLVLGLLIPLSGAVTILQIYGQARARYDLPKVALIVGRLSGLALLAAAWRSADRMVSVALLVSNTVSLVVCLAALRPEWVAVTSLIGQAKQILRQWMHVNKWSVVLRTDILVDRILAAQMTAGFLTLFTLAWSAMMSVVEAYQSSFVAADSNRYYVVHRVSKGAEAFRDILQSYRRSAIAALWLTGGFGLVFGAAYVFTLHDGILLDGISGISSGEMVLLFSTISAAYLVFAFLKQLTGVYMIRGRAVDLARYLVLVYLAVLIPRIWAVFEWGVVAFCLGLIVYYGAQVAALFVFLRKDSVKGVSDSG